ncbi:uncharacterized protein LOC116604619 isoform X2 [Nematostella vectensis]|nr:uncharacterized protein LOC116604619 isoform X2 [Nematostella vectensis]XP_048589180.1 uncharacterized protein LOC116604619 isoform X2 [Nematostella vectensis]XP_048589181.1 uncharacterized protein LOC116604619 isoform X2 [Nematostella vectensis]
MGSLTVVTTESLTTPTATASDMHSTETIIIRNCRTSGLGIKIIGGKSTVGETDYGIFVKKVLVGGRAEAEGHLQEGDHLLEANGESMVGVTNDKAIAILRKVAETNQARLVISRDSQSREEFASLMRAINHGTLTSQNSFSLNGPGALELMRGSSQNSSRASTPSPTMGKRSWVMNGGRMSPLALGRHGSPNWSPSNSLDMQAAGLQRMQAVDFPSGMDSLHNPSSVDPPPYRNQLRLNNLPGTSARNGNGTTSYTRHMNGDHHTSPKHAAAEPQSDSEVTIDSGLPTDRHSNSSTPTFDSPGELQIVRIPVVNGLGLCIVGGTNRPEGPHVYVDNMIDGSDAYRDNRLRRGDQLVTVAGETLVGVTHEQAKSLLTRLKLRRDISEVEIAFIRGGHNSNATRSPLQPLVNGYSPRRSPGAERSSPINGIRSPVNGGSSPVDDISLRQSQLAELHTQLAPNTNRSSTEHDTYQSVSDPQLPSSQSQAVTTGAPDARPEVNAQYSGSSPQAMPHAMSQGQSFGANDGSPFLAQRSSGGFQPMTASTPGMNGAAYGQPPPLVNQISQYNGLGPGRSQYNQSLHYSLPSTFQISPVTPSLQPSSVPFYLQQDLEALGRISQPRVSPQSRPLASGQQVSPEGQQLVSGRPRQSRQERNGRRLSLDPYTRLKVEKLEVALRYLGFEPTEEQQRELRARLPIDHNGCATYGDFVSIAQQLFSMHLKTPKLSTSALQFAVQDINLQEKQHEREARLVQSAPQPSPPSEDLERVKRERDEALREVQYLRKLLKKKEEEVLDTSEEAIKSRMEAQALLEESRSLQNRIHLASQAQKAAKDMEQDYEEVIKLLEKEMAALKLKLEQKGPDPRELEELQKRLVVLGCQLRKAEVSKRTYEVATEKLIHFAELVHDVLSEGGPGMPPARGRGEPPKRDKSGNIRPPSYLGRHAKINPASLAKEARDTVKTVKTLIEDEPLPFGWEEAYTPDGVRYYINHVTQQTSWLHPVSQVQHLPSIMEKNEPGSKKDGVPETRT